MNIDGVNNCCYMRCDGKSFGLIYDLLQLYTIHIDVYTHTYEVRNRQKPDMYTIISNYPCFRTSWDVWEYYQFNLLRKQEVDGPTDTKLRHRSSMHAICDKFTDKKYL